MLWRSWLAKRLVKSGKILIVEVPVITLRTEGGWEEVGYGRIKSEKADELLAWSHEDRSGESRSGGAGRPGTL